MKVKNLSISVVVLGVLLSSGNMRATTISTEPTPNTPAVHKETAHHHFWGHREHRATFNDSAEAEKLRRAYDILKTGDHDYEGHRIEAMHAIEAAAKHLGVILRGDDKDRPPQALSDEKLREARGLLEDVKATPEAKSERRIIWRIDDAIKELNIALSIR